MSWEEISIDVPERTLYIIGNGFDLMHGVPSGYYNFRDSLGQRCKLRSQLETWCLKEDLWADFEDSLAHMDEEGMLGTIPDMMDAMGVLDEDDDDFSAADFFTAAEQSVYPLQVIQEELPGCFRKWVTSLHLSGTQKPLASLIRQEGRYINFNYTEFVESIYGVDKQRILYIHGDRRDGKQELVLGHARGAEEDPAYHRAERKPPYYDQTSYDLFETSGRFVGDYYDATAKKSDEIIHKNREYFDSLYQIEQIVVIGHSLAYVDYPYFREIIRRTKDAVWKISWHGSSDLMRIRTFIDAMDIREEQAGIFRI